MKFILLFFSFLVRQPRTSVFSLNKCKPGYDERYPESENKNSSYLQDIRVRYNLLQHLLDDSISSISKLALIEQHSEPSTAYKINIRAGGLLDDWESTL